MKQTLTASLLLLCICCFAQTPPKNQDGKIEYAEVVTIDSAKAETLFSKAKLYIANAFKSGKDVTQLVDESTHTIVGKGWFQLEEKTMLGGGIIYPVYFTLTLQCKDGRYRYAFNDFSVKLIKGSNANYDADVPMEQRPKGWSQKHQDHAAGEVDAKVKAMVAKLKNDMAANTNNDW